MNDQGFQHTVLSLFLLTLSLFLVLVAHNGFAFDFPILFAEVERCPRHLSLSTFTDQRIHFADTLYHLRQLKNAGDESLKDCNSLGLAKLYGQFFSSKTYPGSFLKISVGVNMKYVVHTTAHRALADVEAMEELFTETVLAHCLPSLPIHTPERQLDLWHTQKDLYTRTSHLINSLGKQSIITERWQDYLSHAKKELHARTVHLIHTLGKPVISVPEARTLDAIGLYLEVLVKLRSNCAIPDEFEEELRLRGVKSKLLRKKLSMLVCPP